MFPIRYCASGAFLLFGLAGCAPMPKMEPIERSVSRLTGIENAFVFRTEAEAIDVLPSTGPRLTLADALMMSIRHDPRIQSAVARVRQAQANAEQARLLPNPVLDISVRFPKGGGASIVDVGLAADLLALLQKPGQISAADHRLRAASADALVVVLDVVAECRRQYAEAQWLDVRATVETERDTVQQQLRNIAKSQLEAGEASQGDVLILDAEHASITSERMELEADQRQARITLAQLIGNPSGSTEWQLDAWKAPESGSNPVLSIAEAAIERRPEVLAQQWRLAAMGEDVKQAKVSLLEGSEVGAVAERDGEWSVGPAITVPLPVFDWGQARQANLEAQKIEARHDLTRARRLVVQEVRHAANRLESARQTLADIDAKLMPLQTKRLQQAKDAYAAGQSDITAVRNAERDLQSARNRRAELQYKLSVATVDLDRAAAGPTIIQSPTTTPSTR